MSAIVASVIQGLFSLYANVLIFDGVMIFSGIYLIFIFKETLSDETQNINQAFYHKQAELHRKSDSLHYDNDQHKCCGRLIYLIKRALEPLWPLYEIKSNPVLFGITMISLFINLPESGIDDISTSYTMDVLQLCTTEQATNYESIATLIAGVTLMLVEFIILPCILVRIFGDLSLFFISLTCILLAIVTGIAMYIKPFVFWGYLMSLFFSFGYINNPVTNGALSKRMTEKEQGIAFGLLHAIKGLTFGVAPIVFALLYDYFHSYKNILKTMPFMVACVFLLMGYPVLFGPLRRGLKCKMYDSNQNTDIDGDDIAEDVHKDPRVEHLERLQKRIAQVNGTDDAELC